jgi:hypothetical protein
MQTAKTGYITPKLNENEPRQLKSEAGEYFEKYDDYEMEIQAGF